MTSPLHSGQPLHIKKYKAYVNRIKELPWTQLSSQELQQLMVLSYNSAVEFAEALRITARLYPNDERLKSMADGELNTNNLQFGDYNTKADHWAFLKHFIDKYRIEASDKTESAGQYYRRYCTTLSDNVRAASIFSREEELSGIFECILKAKDWSAPGLDAFRYYLETHISLDSNEGGHYELTSHFPIAEDLSGFYLERLRMYFSLPGFSHFAADKS